MKVKITKATDNWYKDMIGEVFEVERDYCVDDMWVIINGSRQGWGIMKYNCEEVIDNMGFSKDQLKDNMLVQTKDSEWGIVSSLVHDERGIVFIDSQNCKLRNYDENLKNKYSDECNIVKVATINYLGDFFKVIKGNGSIENCFGYELIWQRESEQNIKLRESLDKLQQQANEIQKQIENIKIKVY